MTRKKGRFRPLKDEITFLPNVLTLARIASLPLVLLTIDNYSRVLSFVSACIFIAGGITDILDGYIARKRGQESVLGAFLDPLADKLFVLGTLVYLTARGRVPDWLVVILLSRELAITVLRSIAATYGLVIKAGAGGKAKTLLQTVGIIFLLVYFPYPLLFVDAVLDFHVVGLGFIYASLFLSLWSAGEYLRFFIQAAEEKHRSHPRDPA
jgi:CDP-diacylglycerol--glycerol-3-phosphate 3-phosphatidyltransferase